jgi:hypothetical protein
VGQDSITLHEAAVLDIREEEAASLVEALNALFREDGIEFAAAAPDRWYVRVPAGEVPSTIPIDEVAGRNVFKRLPQGTGRVNWGSALTEAQTLFAAHPVNAARDAGGRPAINGVWFWGEGELVAAIPRTYDAVHGGDEVVRGLARLTGADAPAGDGPVLRVLDTASRAIREGDVVAWQRALEALETEWFALLDTLSHRYGTVRLVVPGLEATRIFTAGRKPLLSWPKAPRPWTSHA